MNRPTPREAASTIYFNTLIAGGAQFTWDGGTSCPVWYWRTGIRMWMSFITTVAVIYQAVQGDE